MTFELFAYWGAGSNMTYQYGCASLFVDGVETIRAVQKSKTLKQYALTYICMEKVLDAYNDTIEELTIIEQANLGLKGKGKTLREYIANLKNRYLKDVKLNIKDDASICAQKRKTIESLINDIEFDVASIIRIQTEALPKSNNNSQSIKNSVVNNTLKNNATTWESKFTTQPKTAIDEAPRTSKLMQKFLKESTNKNTKKETNSSYRSRAIIIKDVRGQKMLTQFDRLPENKKQKMWEFFKTEIFDINDYNANNWKD